MANVEEMRTYISKMYPSDNWLRRVKLMDTRQVVAIYKNMRQKGQKPVKSKDIRGQKTQQLSIFDLEEMKNA